MKPDTTILSADTGLHVMEALRHLIDKLEDSIHRGERMLADQKSYTDNAREYIKQRNDLDKKCCEEIKALIKEVRYERI